MSTPGSHSGLGVRQLLWHASIFALIFYCQMPVARAGSIPFQEAWTYDGPLPHGPGAPLVSHLPYNVCGLGSDSMLVEGPGAPVEYQYLADDFQLPFDSLVSRLVVWGFYNSQILPTTDETFQIKVHQPRPSDGLPGAVVFEETVVNPFREWTGRNVITVGGGREYRFVIDLSEPLFIQGSEIHWLSFYQIGEPNSSFRWECSQNPPPANGQASNNVNFPNWHSTFPTMTSNTAYELYSIPEPTTCMMLFAGSLVCLLRRRALATFFPGKR